MLEVPYLFIQIGPLALLVAVITTPLLYWRYARAPEPKAALPLTTFMLTALVIAIAAFIVGTMAGVALACAPDDAGNLCGLAGLFGTGPLLSALAVIAFAYMRTRNACGIRR